MTSSINVEETIGTYQKGLGNLNTLVSRFEPYHKELDKQALESTRARVRAMYKDGTISADAAKSLGQWSKQFSGPLSGMLEGLPVVGGLFRWIMEILSKVPIFNKILTKNFG